MMQNDVTIIVNSSDGFEDCWEPFFKLFTLYWPDCDCKIILNTEFKSYKYPGLNIAASKANLNTTSRKLSWSECLINALKEVETPLVIYMQEDYFIETSVLASIINDFSKKMIDEPLIKYIGLTHFGNYPPFKVWNGDERLWEVSQNARYRISTQAALWRKETLLSYLRPEENGWMFEIFGTKRAKHRKELFLTSNRDIYHPQKGTAIIQYEHTGIIKGQWHHLMPALFNKHDIDVDFSKRGLYKQKPWILRKIETAKKLMRNPMKFFYGIMGK